MTRHSNHYGAFEIDSLPGQSQVAVCHAFVVPEDRRGQGHGHQLKHLQEIELDLQHYDFAICTVAAVNYRQKRILAKAGWQRIAAFRNRRSCETTEMWARSALPEDRLDVEQLPVIPQPTPERRDHPASN